MHDDCERKEGCFRCHYCSMKFSYICHMVVHERVHTGEKPYSCELCGHQFSQLGSLTVHVRNHTGETLPMRGMLKKVSSRQQSQASSTTGSQHDKRTNCVFHQQGEGRLVPGQSTERNKKATTKHRQNQFTRCRPDAFRVPAIATVLPLVISMEQHARKLERRAEKTSLCSSGRISRVRKLLTGFDPSKSTRKLRQEIKKSKKAPTTWRPSEVGPEEDRKETEWSSKHSREGLISFNTVDRFHEVCDSLKSIPVNTRPPPLLQPYANDMTGPEADANRNREDTDQISQEPRMKDEATEEYYSADEGFSSCGSPERLRSPQADFMA